MSQRSIAVFGATGSVGAAVLAHIRALPGLYRANVLTGHRQVTKMVALALEFQPEIVVMSDGAAAKDVRAALPSTIEVRNGPDALRDVATLTYDLMVAAIVGTAGLPSTYAALQAGRDVALANKESLVCAGQLFLDAAEQSGAKILPLDSEHNAIFQCWEERHRAQIQSVQLTGSGGPFRGWNAQAVRDAPIQKALTHPNWSMGPKITLDSATLMNKALEMIEARWLFDLRAEQIQVVIHPQSIVHSCVTYADGTVMAQLGQPDMRTPVAYCLAYPARAPCGGAPLDLLTLGGLTFEAVDEAAFPSIDLARQAIVAGSSAGLRLNAVNEALNAAVRNGQLDLGGFFALLMSLMEASPLEQLSSLEDILAADAAVRAECDAAIAGWG